MSMETLTSFDPPSKYPIARPTIKAAVIKLESLTNTFLILPEKATSPMLWIYIILQH